MIWSPQQDDALVRVSDWLKDNAAPQVFKLWGYAGTGKTTLARHLAESVQGTVLFAAYTGKAASVLRRAGCEGACTIHSLLYSVTPASTMKLMELADSLRNPKLSDFARTELEKEYTVEAARAKHPSFIKNPGSVIRQAALLVLDECSMVNENIANDLQSFGTKILVLGDPAQLPPVRGSGYYTSGKPDILLSEIHRQALDSPIVRWGKLVREGGQLPIGIEGTVKRVPRASIDDAAMAAAGQILTGKNETRRDINRRVRAQLGFTAVYPHKGERIVILRNDKEYAVLNGVVCETLSPAIRADEDPDEAIQHRILYEGAIIPRIVFCRSQFDAYADPKRADGYDFRKRWIVPADFGYALTVHKSQGSQWDDVMVYDDGFAKREGLTRRRWLYTAITRAQTSLTIAF